MIRSALIWLVLLAMPAAAQEGEEVVLGLSQNRIQITANFDGSELLIFGAVKRQSPIPEDPLEVVVTVAGPSMPVTVHRKNRKLGIWVNADTVHIDSAPSFYAVAATGPVHEVVSYTEDLRHHITISRAVRSVGAEAEDPRAFTDALIRIREAEEIYAQLDGAVDMDQQTLFRTNVALPANLIEGGYAVRVFLTRDRRVVSQFETVIEVRKVGLERWLYTLAQENAPLYGLLSLFLAVLAGWGASTGFRLLRSW